MPLLSLYGIVKRGESSISLALWERAGVRANKSEGKICSLAMLFALIHFGISLFFRNFATR